jgi:hypothetical protein
MRRSKLYLYMFTIWLMSFTLGAWATKVYAAPPEGYNADPNRSYSTQEIVDQGHAFFGKVSQNLAKLVERVVSERGQPNGYILGEEAGGAFVGGLRYGEGRLYTKNAGQHRVYWQGPSIGLDAGAEGTRVMMLVYNLPSVDALYQRFPGANGSAFVVGGFGASAAQNGNIVVVPIRSGVGARMGLSVGYLKFTRKPTWNPF